jgi:hypothetical protein
MMPKRWKYPVSVAWVALADADVDHLRGVLDRFERGLASELAHLMKQPRSELQSSPGDELAAADDRWELENVMPQVVRRMVFTATYSFLENRLNGVCRGLQMDLQLPLAPEEVAGKGIRRAHTFLTRLGGVNFGKGDSWQKTLLYGELRNAVVHSEARVKKSHASGLKGQLAQLGGCSLNDHNRLILDEGFCNKFLDHVKKVLSELLKALSERLHQ